MIRFLFIRCLVFISSIIAALANTSITTDQDALLALKAHITHDPTNFFAKNWNTITPVCNWTGVTCDVRSHRVTALNISHLNLTGTIPSQLGNLSSLQILTFRDNQLSGSFPSLISNMSSLQHLDFSFNKFSGEIPRNICSNLPILEYLSLSQNMFHGRIPSTLSNCTYLQILGLSINDFSGAIPREIGNLAKLKELYLGVNRLQGKIPQEFANLAELEVMSLSENKLHGEISQELGNLTELKILWLFTNFLTGTIPSSISKLSSLFSLDLSHNNLTGTVPSHLGNLSSLQILDLSDNQLTGSFPSSIFKISSLKVLDFSVNRLFGELPANFCHNNLHFLEELHIMSNNFHGKIPSTLSNCKLLQKLSLSFNDFVGAIPKEIGNLTKLKMLNFFSNRLQGEIPHEIGNLHNLEELVLGQNKLVGIVPITIFNLSTLKLFAAENNSLSGRLASIADGRLPNLKNLNCWGNNFSGTIPRFIFNASKLSTLSLATNSFSGFIPSTFGNLRNLRDIRLFDNYLTSSTPELSFLSSLSNCKYLKLLDLSINPLHGFLPRVIGNFSQSVEVIFMTNCNISGGIPEEIGNLTNLTTIDLGGNKFNGSISITLGKLQKLQLLRFRDNKLEGSIPDVLCHLAALFRLDLSGNKLSGSIPACFGNLTTLRNLHLGSNGLTSIPSTLWNLEDILFLDFSSNLFTGPLPLEIGNLKVLTGIDFSRNNLSGDIPTTIQGLKSLLVLSLGHNSLQGSIPNSFGDLVSLEFLDLSNNNLSGIIPPSLKKLLYLKYLNLSFNKLEGEIPRGGPFTKFSSKSFIGNDLLCGSPNLQVPPCKSNKTSTHGKSRKNALLLGIVLPLSIVLIVVVTLALRFGLISRCQKRATELPNVASMQPQASRRRFSYLELLRATDRFNENNLIGRGSFGSVYKARLQDGMELAVKVFHLQFERAWKSFDVECEVMKSIRHRNLVKIISSCSNEDFRALVLEYMTNGSLEKGLYSSNYILDIFQRLNIMIDVASALEYLHFGYSTPIIHCDLKPHNVLLDDNMVAHLSDFGIAKLLTGKDQSMTQTQTLATIGYMAPEYGREGRVSINGDVYSFGILLMETFTRKKPTDEIFVGEMTLKCWVNDLLPISIMEVVDANLLNQGDSHFAAKEECVSFVFSLAMECTVESPEQRINAKEIVTKLLKIRDLLLKNVGGRRMRQSNLN